MLLRRLPLIALAAACLVPAAGGADAGRNIPVGVYGNVERFDRMTGQQTDSGLAFIGWDQGRTYGKPYSYFLEKLVDRPHIALKTERGGGTISTRAIALGQGDAHIIGLAEAMSEAGKPVLLRPLGEMNNTFNSYCACRGNAENSAKWYRKAFQRIYLISHGGTADQLTRKLRRLKMPGVSADVPVSPYPQLTVVWNPLAVGEPPIPGNSFRDYFPGLAFFDMYGNDYYNFGTYSFVRTTDLYKAYPSKPFGIPEWGDRRRRSWLRPGVCRVGQEPPASQVPRLLQREERRPARPRRQAARAGRVQAPHRAAHPLDPSRRSAAQPATNAHSTSASAR